jgi:hypothetical protein
MEPDDPELVVPIKPGTTKKLIESAVHPGAAALRARLHHSDWIVCSEALRILDALGGASRE